MAASAEPKSFLRQAAALYRVNQAEIVVQWLRSRRSVPIDIITVMGCDCALFMAGLLSTSRAGFELFQMVHLRTDHRSVSFMSTIHVSVVGEETSRADVGERFVEAVDGAVSTQDE